MNNDREVVESQFLMFSIDEYLYQFVKEINHIEFRKENGEISDKAFYTEFEIAKEDYLKRKGTGINVKCILIPTKEMPFVLATDMQHKKALGDVQRIFDFEFEAEKTIKTNIKLTPKKEAITP
ncbi:MAG: hypothetical protein GX638_10255 [Crenarchaeota archaeon]|nr:hypothetical protein [Thermoproteota archaeon]